MFWIALELSIPKIGLNIMLSLTVKKLDEFKFDGVAESDNTGKEHAEKSLSKSRAAREESRGEKKLLITRK